MARRLKPLAAVSSPCLTLPCSTDICKPVSNPHACFKVLHIEFQKLASETNGLTLGISTSGKQHPQHLFMGSEIRHDPVCTDANQPLALHEIDLPALRLVRGHADRDTANLFDVLDLNEPVTETKELTPQEPALADDLVDQDLLRERFVVVERPEATTFKEVVYLS